MTAIKKSTAITLELVYIVLKLNIIKEIICKILQTFANRIKSFMKSLIDLITMNH